MTGIWSPWFVLGVKNLANDWIGSGMINSTGGNRFCVGPIGVENSSAKVPCGIDLGGRNSKRSVQVSEYAA
jgi:hypothetical protein